MVERYCRLCANLSPHTVNMFEELGGRQLLFFKIINNLNIVLNRNDPLPKDVCVLCMGKLEFVEKFKNDCQTAQLTFRKMLLDNLSSKLSISGDFHTQTMCKENEKQIIDEEKPSVDDLRKIDVLTEVNDSESKKSVPSKSIVTTSEHIILPVQMEVVEESDADDSENCNDENSCSIAEDLVIESYGSNNCNKCDCKDDKVDSVTFSHVDKKQTVFRDNVNTDNRIETEKGFIEGDIGKMSDDNVDNDLDHNDVNSGKIVSLEDIKSTDRSNKDDRVISLGSSDCGVSVDRLGKVVLDNCDADVCEVPYNLLYALSIEKQTNLINLNVDPTVHSVECINNLLENKASLMPYFFKWTNIEGGIHMAFRCPLCHTQLYRRGNIMRHLKKHFYFCCDICKDILIYRNISKFKNHFNYNHKFQILHEKKKCQYCNDKFDTIESYVEHAPCNFQHACGFCTFKANDVKVLSTHIKDKHSEYRNNCIDCSLFYGYDDSLKEHIITFKGVKFTCTSCGMNFHTEEFLNLHYQIFGKDHTPDKSNNDEKCIGNSEGLFNASDKASASSLTVTSTSQSKQFGFLYERPVKYEEIIKFFQDVLSRKINLSQLPVTKINGYGHIKVGFKCPLCPKGVCVDREKKLFSHFQNHLLLSCVHCKRTISGSLRFQSHFYSKLHRDKELVFNCVVCKNNSEFIGVKKYLDHVKDHAHKRVCIYCSLVFKNVRALSKHLNIVHKDILDLECTKKFVCEHCGRKFNTSHCLTTHINGCHFGQWPKIKKKICSECGSTTKNHAENCTKIQIEEKFICAYCSKVFHVKNYLIKHINVHLNMLSYECKFCGKRFNRKSSLTKHKLDMHSKRKWPCPVSGCKSSFAYKSGLETHAKAVHRTTLK